MANYVFVKNIVGGLSFPLESYDFSLPTKTFTIPYNVDKITVPQQYALGLFVSSEALMQFKNGYFTVENYEDLERAAAALGLTGDKSEIEVHTVADISKALHEGNMEVIDSILKSDNAIELNNMLVIARAEFDRLSGAVISKIEESCGVELKIE